jgi:predicted nucleotidyltransferase
MLLEFAREKTREGLRARFFFFGSRVRGDFQERSDFDLAVDAGAPLDPITLGRLRDDLHSTESISSTPPRHPRSSGPRLSP